MIARFIRNETAATAAEFALVLPLLLLMMFGIVDAARFMWVYNHAEKAAQMGARMAVVTTPISDAMSGTYVGACTPPLTQGDLIPSDCFTTIVCTSSGCDSGTKDDAAFTAIFTRMQAFLPDLAEDNVAVEYSPAGLGYAGNPNGPDISPMVTVKIGTPATPLLFTPITSLLLASGNMPNFTTSLTAEDLNGSASN